MKPDVYFIQASNGLIKVGSSRHPEIRLSELRSASPVPLRLLGSIRDAGHEAEKHLQYHFRDVRDHGEWFHPSPYLLDYIAEHATAQPDPRIASKYGQHVRRLREERSWSRETLAERSGIRLGVIRALEAGRTTEPRMNTLLPIADAFGVPIDALTTEEEPAADGAA